MTTLIVTIRQSEGGGTYEFEPEEGENIRWETNEGRLFLKRGKWNDDKGFYTNHEVFRVFAHGVWSDVEVVD